MTPLLSIVVPYYNVGAYIRECLESIACQALADVEVILVDDGSLDGSVDVAVEFVERDTRFRLCRQPNKGLGQARNVGAAMATGTYLAFADSDDVVAHQGYSRLVAALELSGSDMAAGGAYRLALGGARPFGGFRGIFDATMLRTHIVFFPQLVRDRMIWNKVFRRSFWCRERLRFPTVQYEDAVVAMRAHCRAEAMDVVAEAVYYWRYRDSGDSITQRRFEVSNLLDRAQMIAETGRVLASCSTEVKEAYDQDMCSGYDMRLLAFALTHATHATALDPARKTLAGYLRTVSPQVIDGLHGPHRDRLNEFISGLL